MRAKGAGGTPFLPVEVWWTVLDCMLSSTTFAEHVALGQVCKAWRLWSDNAFSLWLANHAVGEPLKSFSGSGYELGFVMRHVKGEHKEYGVVRDALTVKQCL
jgi:hypothetical protein